MTKKAPATKKTAKKGASPSIAKETCPKRKTTAKKKASARGATDGIALLRKRYVDGQPERIAQLKQLREDAKVGRKIYDLRTKAGLTQQDLATLVGTTRTAITRLEDADYEGHSLPMLRRIAEALNKRVEIRFISLPEEAHA